MAIFYPDQRAMGRVIAFLAISASFVLVAQPALAHVKWFAPFIVGARPRPVGETLVDPWFWLGIALVVSFFLATVAVERTRFGLTALNGLDRVTDPLWRRGDDFMRATIAAFFIAVFSVGGVYLTPDLKTPNEFVSWVQLGIAAGIFSRRTMPLSAAGIVGLWLLALTDYDLFHLLDYFALGVSVAAYLVLASVDDPKWRDRRFRVLRWGVAIALMWSSLEKFAYPEWFYSLIEEKPFITFGMPRDVFIPMAGVAEFTLGFGLLWSPLVRRLSALALFVIFTTAVYPFGRVELVGHALIMAVLVMIAADHARTDAALATAGRAPNYLPSLPRAATAVPAVLALALTGFTASYWGLHRTIYGPEGRVVPDETRMATHSYSPEHPHGPGTAGEIGAPRDMHAAAPGAAH